MALADAEPAVEEASDEAPPADQAPAPEPVAEETQPEAASEPVVEETAPAPAADAVSEKAGAPQAEKAPAENADTDVTWYSDGPGPEPMIDNGPVLSARGISPMADVGPVQARMRDHLGVENGTTGNCIRYSPPSTASSSDWVGAGGEAITAHGNNTSRCPSTLNVGTQSAVGFAPAAVTDIPVGGVSSLGTITHYNNPITVNDNYFTGVLDIRLPQAESSPVFSFPWTLHETPNRPGDVDDITEITVQSPPTVIYLPDGEGGRKPYRMVLAGFSSDCASGKYENRWVTPERTTTSSQLCAQLTQVRTLEIVKQVEVPEGFTGTVPAFPFESTTTMTNLEGVESFWSNNFSLTPTLDAAATTGQHDVLVPNQTVTVTEQVPDGWELVRSECTGEGASADGATATFEGLEVDTEAKLPAKCTFTNRPVMKPLTIDKTVTNPTYTQHWTWDIDKSVNPDGTMTNPAASPTEFEYTVTVTPTPGEQTDGRYTTNLTITNPNPFPVSAVELVDETCTVAEPTLDFAANETKNLTLSCTSDAVADGVNTARISWLSPYDVHGTASDRATYSFANATVVDGEYAVVDVTDTFPEFADAYPDATVRGDGGAKVFTYRVTHEAPIGECREFVNTATITQTGQEDSAEAKVCNQADLGASKNVVTSLQRTYAWTIDKSVVDSTVVVDPATGKAHADYTVVVTEGAYTDSNWSMTGEITVTNPNNYVDAVVTVTDATNIGGECTVDDGVDATIPAGESKTFTYSCLFTEAPTSYSGTNTATVTWADQNEPSQYTASFTAADWDLTEKMKDTVVSDTFPELADTYSETERTLTWSEAGKQHTFTYTHEFTGDELPAAGECVNVDNTASLSTGGNDTVEVDVCAGKLSFTKEADQKTDLQVGDTVTYTFTATNEGQIPLTNVSITDTEFGGTGDLSDLTCTPAQPATLAPGASLICTATYTVVEGDLGLDNIYNLATATSDETPPTPDDETVTTTQHDLTVTKSVKDPTYLQDYDWAITKTVDPDGTMDDPAVSGTTFSYTVTVTPTATTKHSASYTTVLLVSNPNTFDVRNVQVSDENCYVGDDDTGFTLAAGVTREILLSCTAPSVEDPGTNQATITWDKPGSDTPGTAASNIVDLDFSTALVEDGAHATVDVSDTFPEFADAYGEVSIHATGGEQVYTYSIVHTSPLGECAEFTNVAQVTGDDDAVLDEDDTAAKVCNRADVEVTKNVITSLDRTYAWEIDKSVDDSKLYVDPAVGEATAEYTIVVTEGAFTDSNWVMTGTITVTNPNDYVDAVVTVTDATSIGGDCVVAGGTDATIPAGEDVEFTYTCTWDEQPASYDGDNVATVEWAEQDEPSSYTANFVEADWELTEYLKDTVVNDTFPELAEKYSEAERTLTWSEEGTQHTFTYTHTFTGEEFPEAGECVTVDNTAWLTTGGDDTVEVELCAGKLTLTKTADPQVFDAAGQTITYTLVAENTGPVTLYDVTITDELLGLDAEPCAAELAPGESCTITMDYVVTQADMDAGFVYNAASTTGTDPGDNPVPGDDDETTEGEKKPGIHLVKQVDRSGLANVGDELVYTFVVTNTGNVTLTNVTVHDPMLTDLGLKVTCPATELAPGEKMECVSDGYVVTEADAKAGKVHNVATVTAEDPDGDPVKDDDEVTVEVTPPQAPPVVKPKPPVKPKPKPVIPSGAPEGMGPNSDLVMAGTALLTLAAGATGMAATRRRRC